MAVDVVAEPDVRTILVLAVGRRHQLPESFLLWLVGCNIFVNLGCTMSDALHAVGCRQPWVVVLCVDCDTHDKIANENNGLAGCPIEIIN